MMSPKLMSTSSRDADDYRMYVVETMSPMISDIDRLFEIMNSNLSPSFWERRIMKNPRAVFDELVRGCRA